MQEPAAFFSVERYRDLPVVAVALHDGHAVRGHVARWMAISDSDCLSEENPDTGVSARGESDSVEGPASQLRAAEPNGLRRLLPAAKDRIV